MPMNMAFRHQGKKVQFEEMDNPKRLAGRHFSVLFIEGRREGAATEKKWNCRQFCNRLH